MNIIILYFVDFFCILLIFHLDFFVSYCIVKIYRYYLSKGDHWFRMKNVREDQATNSQGHHDYFEIVPKAVVTDPTMPEDRY